MAGCKRTTLCVGIEVIPAIKHYVFKNDHKRNVFLLYLISGRQYFSDSKKNWFKNGYLENRKNSSN